MENKLNSCCAVLRHSGVSNSPWGPICDPMDCGPPGSSAHGILQARIMSHQRSPNLWLPKEKGRERELRNLRLTCTHYYI